MQFRTIVKVDQPSFQIPPFERMLFVGSCFADSMGQRFIEDKFRVTVNPYGVMYNPASILHTVERTDVNPNVAVFTLGTNHVYILKETGEIVDNCQKRPQRLFREAELSVEECAAYLSQAVECLMKRNDKVRVILTVSPIRYAKYGFHGSQLSKATLLLATRQLEERYPGVVTYFPAYEIVNDELRDYRFYKEGMLHPSDQAVAYIWERFFGCLFQSGGQTFLGRLATCEGRLDASSVPSGWRCLPVVHPSDARTHQGVGKQMGCKLDESSITPLITTSCLTDKAGSIN